MLQLRYKQDRGHTQISWLDSYHTFSFGDYYDPGYMGFSDLRVINDDRVKPGAGFATHAHRDMEIVTVVLSGALEHKDSMENGSVIRPGDVQRMTAGTGVTHSEFNPSQVETGHFLQIWIMPEAKNLEPGYEQKHFEDQQKHGRWCLVASRDGREGSVIIHQDAEIYLTLLHRDEALDYSIPSGRRTWVHVATGTVEMDGQLLEEGDGVGIAEEERILHFKALEDDSQVMVFNLR